MRLVACLMAVGLAVGTAFAGISPIYTDYATWAASGTVSYTYGYEDRALTESEYIPPPWVVGPLTHNNAYGCYVLPAGDTDFLNESKILTMVYPFEVYLDISIDGASMYSMMGFEGVGLDMAGWPSENPMTIYTNMGTYSIVDLPLPRTGGAMSFFGWTADPGEYFTRFRISVTPDPVLFELDLAAERDEWLALDDISLGTLGSEPEIPEPATTLFLGLGSLIVAAVARRRK